MQQPDLFQIFLRPLENSGLSYFVTGSIASIIYGEPRLTHDIDLVLHLPLDRITEFINLYPESDFYCPPEEVIRVELVRKPFGHFNLIHQFSGLKADVYTSSQDKLHDWALKNRRKTELATGLSFWIAPPEYVIIRKLEYYREGGSDKHLDDIRKMLPQVDSKLDKNFLKKEIEGRSLEKQAAEIEGFTR